ncbi:hypothetical protein K431DRAFT_233928 [Polychaeton citri CBS 116435]|uniref:F-box domain-containing protein n=1 Tax=Polychaeton citri CBS 116435 TaxID=1314669 RepID=A0A9P4Q2C2_9PEZI|nr:hypothetical protein K431DRAFT_233928 [Polychaeton citri CBS 116435]
MTPTTFHKFGDLSTEIKSQIIDFVLRPSDLKNVCLTCSSLRDLAVKPLYRNVAFDLGQPKDTVIAAFLNPKNKGLQHVRQIRLYLASVRDRCNQDQMAHMAARMIIELMPEDVLEEFSWCPWKPFSADNLLLLYRKQRRMKWLEVMDLDRDILPELKRQPKLQGAMFGNARKLALYPENRITLDMCQFMVEKSAPVLEELIVHCNFPDNESRDMSPPAGAIPPRELMDSATQPGLVTRTIFRHMLPFDDDCKPFPNLKSVRLHRISLRHCADTWCKVIDFTQIQNIRLYQCPGADSLFGQLSKAKHLPKLLKVLEFQHKDNSEEEALMSLDGFLCLVSGIRDLIIDVQNVKSLPTSASIARHGRTMELLSVHCSNEASQDSGLGEDGELVWEYDEFEKICKSCVGLEQLSCAWPSTSLIRSASTDWRSFQRCAIDNLRKMVTLHITTWPTNKPSTQLLPRHVYEFLLQGLAMRLFADAHIESPSPPPIPSARLRLISFGISDKVYEREDSKNSVNFLRSTCIDAHGHSKVFAAPLGWCARQFVEPRSEVLDFVLHRESRPPCREMGYGDEDEYVTQNLPPLHDGEMW